MVFTLRPDASGEYEEAGHRNVQVYDSMQVVWHQQRWPGITRGSIRPGSMMTVPISPPRVILLIYRVAFPARTQGESSPKEQPGDETGNKTRLPVDQNREAREGSASALRERETLSCDDVISILQDRCPDFRISEKPSRAYNRTLKNGR